MQEVTLNEVLLAREERARFQKVLIDKYRCPVICYTMNIAGPVKNSPLIERAFKRGLELLESELSDKKILFRKENSSPTGCEAFFAVEDNANSLKEICVSIEESSTLGRLFDMDVLSENGEKLERQHPRACIICGTKGKGCAARRIHSVSELQETTCKIISEYFSIYDKEKIADLAVKSLLDEVYTTPKPGLVDRQNSGSHSDMDINTFIASANSLRSYFYECVNTGQKNSGNTPEETFPPLREAGLIAEKDMYFATGGVNTHKGIIYSMGVICAAIGRLWKPEVPFAEITDILSVCSEIVKSSVKADFECIDKNTAGGRLYLEKGLMGIRGEVLNSFPSVTSFGLPIYTTLLKKGLCQNDAGAITLLHFISNVEDTNLYSRGGSAGADFAASAARSLLKSNPFPDAKQISELDVAFTERNLSPGGCADLLAITYFLYSLHH